MLVIVDYGLGNLGSIANMCKRLAIEAQVSSRPEDLGRATRLILPGVGSFDEGMKNLAARDLVGPLRDRVLGAGVPVLGICLGAQLMTRGSEEGGAAGLGWIEADTVRFPAGGLKVPHMGWADVTVEKPSSLFAAAAQPRFYFVHSYHFVCRAREDVAASAEYGARFDAAFVRKNVHGVQFHPEKSHRFGMALLKGFAEAA